MKRHWEKISDLPWAAFLVVFSSVAILIAVPGSLLVRLQHKPESPMFQYAWPPYD